MEVAISVLVIVFYTRGFIRKEDPNITILDIKSNQNPYMDLKQSKQLLLLTHFIAGINPVGIWQLKAYSVVQDTKTRTILEKNPLQLVDCKQLEDLFNQINLKYETGDLFQYQECIDFKDGTLIGMDNKTGIKKSILIEVMPCLTDCHKYTFPVPVGLQEITPNNAFPFFPVYRTFMHELNKGYILSLHYTSAVTDFLNYDTPAKMFVGLPELHKFSLDKTQISTVTF